MTTIVTRAGKGSPLTHTEVDTNFTNLNTKKLETAAIPLGTLAAPSISFVGDANTGAYSPGADTLAFVTAGSNRVHITSAGLVGIGSSSPQGLLDCSKAGKGGIVSLDSTAYAAGVGGTIDLGGNYRAAGDFQPFVRIAAEKTNSTNQDYGYNMGFYVTTNGGATFGTKALTIDSTGRLGIGTTSPGALLDVTGSNGKVLIANGTSSNSMRFSAQNATGTGNAAMVFESYNLEYGRFDTSGRLLVGTDTGPLINESQIGATGAGNTACLKTTVSGNNPLLLWNSATSGDNLFCSFFTEASYTTRGTIDYNRAAGLVRYNVTSDRRLKSEIQPATSAVDLLSSIQVRSYKWTETDYTVNYGFIAQELNVVLPDAVKQGDDGDEVVDAWAVDNSKVVPLLTKALQEAIAKIETLESRLTAAGL